jgi:flavin-binding protein dodecin
VDQAAKSIDHIQSVYISDFQAILDEAGTIDSYRINAKVTFVVED